MQCIRLSRDGGHVATIDREEVRLVSVPAMTTLVRREVEHLRDLTLFDDQAWIVSGERPMLEALDLTGKRIAPPVSLELGPTGGRLVRCPFGAASAVWLGREAIHLVLAGDRIESRPIGGSFDFALPVAPGQLLGVRGGTAWLSASADDWTASHKNLPGTAVDGCALREGRAVALVTEQQDAQHLLVLATRSGGLHHRLRLSGIDGARFAARRGYALLRAGRLKLLAVDLRAGQVIKTFEEPCGIIDFALDDGGEHLVLQLCDGSGGVRPVYAPFAEFLAASESAPARSQATGRTRPNATSTTRATSAEVPDGSAIGPAESRPAPVPAPAPVTSLRSGGAAGKLPRAVIFQRREPAPAPVPVTSLRSGGAAGKLPRAAIFQRREPVPVPAPAPSDPRPVLLGELPRPPALAEPAPSGPAPVLRLFLDKALDRVAAWCYRAIALAWNSGRLAPAAADALPYQQEVEALLGLGPERAGEALDHAERLVRQAEQTYRFLREESAWEMDGERPRIVDRRDPAAARAPTAWPLNTLADHLGLSELACDLLVAVLAPTARIELVRLFALVRGDRDRPLCDEMLLSQLMPRVSTLAISQELDEGAPLVRHGIVRRGAGERRFAPLSVNPALLSRLCGFPESEPRRLLAESPSGGLWVAGEAEAGLRRALEGATAPLRLLLRGRRGSGRRTLAAMIARSSGRTCVELDLGAVPPGDRGAWLREELTRAHLLDRVVCLSGYEDLDLAGHAGGAVTHLLRESPCPVLLRAGLDSSPGGELRFTPVDLPPLDESARRLVWQHALADVPGGALDLAERLAARHAAGPGAVAVAAGRLAGCAKGSVEDSIAAVDQCLAEVRDARLGSAASKVRALPRWHDLVLPEDVWERLHELCARMVHRRTVHEEWGFRTVATTALGITALFQGGPGTGKTLAAGAIARELGFDLYRVDVSRIVSKWIGETEKNLARVFDAAEDGRVILLFDEADSLFARRTEVKSSVDRHANSEVNFLLQRLDSFEGVAVLTTNRPGAMDPAFQRRLTMAVTFPDPDEELRQRLWRVHIPEAAPRAANLDLETLARRHSFSGGHIRNAAMRGLFLAAMERAPLSQAHLEKAVNVEYQTMGRLSQEGA